MSTDLALVLEDLGVEIKRQSGDEIQGRCPVHHLYKGRESDRYSWYINSDTGLWHCFTCGARGNLALLVGQLTDDVHAIRGVQRFLIDSGLHRLQSDEEEEHVPVVADWAKYAGFKRVPAPLLEARMLDSDVAHRYGIRFDPEEKMLITPVVTDIGSPLGWQAKRGKFFMNVPEGLHKSNALFGMNMARADTGLLVESPLDVVRFHSAYTGNDISAVSSYGASVSDAQISLLQEHFNRLIVAMDNDSAGILESRRLVGALPPKRGVASPDLLAGFRKGVKWLPYEDSEAKDIGEMNDDEINDRIQRVTVLRP